MQGRTDNTVQWWLTPLLVYIHSREIWLVAPSVEQFKRGLCQIWARFNKAIWQRLLLIKGYGLYFPEDINLTWIHLVTYWSVTKLSARQVFVLTSFIKLTPGQFCCPVGFIFMKYRRCRRLCQETLRVLLTECCWLQITNRFIMKGGWTLNCIHFKK